MSLHSWRSCDWGNKLAKDLSEKKIRFYDYKLPSVHKVSPLLCSKEQCVKGFVDIPHKKYWIHETICERKDCDLNDYVNHYCKQNSKNCITNPF